MQNTENHYPKFKVKEPKYQGKAEAGQMEFKFWSGGLPFFGLVNPKNLNKTRYDAAQQVYRELERGLDSEKLEGFLTIIEEAIWSKEDKQLRDALWLTSSIKSRSNISNYAYLAFKLASVYYVGADEDFNVWDWEIARKKVNHWMQHEQDLDAFFLQTHVIGILPFTDFSKSVIQKFSHHQKATDNNQIAIMLHLLNENKTKTGSADHSNIIKSLMLRQWPTNYSEPTTPPNI